jgi:hypothetical protein
MRKLTVAIMATSLVAAVGFTAPSGTAQAATPQSAQGCTGLVDAVCLGVNGGGDNVQWVGVTASFGLQSVVISANIGGGVWEYLAGSDSVSGDGFGYSWVPNGINLPSSTTQICAFAETTIGAYTPCIGVHP